MLSTIQGSFSWSLVSFPFFSFKLQRVTETLHAERCCMVWQFLTHLQLGNHASTSQHACGGTITRFSKVINYNWQITLVFLNILSRIQFIFIERDKYISIIFMSRKKLVSNKISLMEKKMHVHNSDQLKHKRATWLVYNYIL